MDVYLVDTPGFGDSGGAETDISNGMSIVKSLLGCESIKLTVILSRDELYFNKMGGTILMSQVIANLFTELKPVLPSMSIFFNKFYS